jgi:predicted DNA-binding protein
MREDEELSKWLQIRVSPRLKRLAGMVAEARGKDTSNYIRDRIRDDAEEMGLSDFEFPEDEEQADRASTIE